MRQGGNRSIVVIVAAVIGCAATASIAMGDSSGPVARIACAETATSCQESGDNTLPANGYGSQSTDTVPTRATSGTELVAPFNAEELDSFDSNWETIVGAFPKLGGIKNVFVRRVLTCAVFAPAASAYLRFFGSAPDARATDTSQLFLTLCLQIVYQTQLAQREQLAAGTASAGCSPALQSIPIQIKRSGGTYVARLAGTPRRVRRTPLVVSCRRQGQGLRISMHPRARGRTLRQVIGGHMGIGISNPTNTPVKVHTVFSFR